MKTKLWLGALAVALNAFCMGNACAQTFPSKPVTFISPYAPGGTTDILARILAPRLQQALGQPFLVEYRPGAGGNVGTAMVEIGRAHV